MNFLRGKRARMHHIAFEVRDFSAVEHGCDVLSQHHIPIIWGPLRHGPGHNVSIYHRNPDQHVIEFFAELDQILDEELGYFDPRPWHADRPQRPKVWTRESRALAGWGPPPTRTIISTAMSSAMRHERSRGWLAALAGPKRHWRLARAFGASAQSRVGGPDS